MTTVYVLEMGCYENRTVWGIYDSAERAMARATGRWTKNITIDDDGTESVDWTNDEDWDAAARVWGCEVITAGTERNADDAEVQIYRPLDGGWVYLPASPEALRVAHEAHAYILRHRKRGMWSEPEPTEVDRQIEALATHGG